MSSPLLIQIDLTGTAWSSSIYYVSNETFEGANLYLPFVVQPPVIEIGGTNSGFLRVQLGQLILTNEPANTAHPFYGARFTQLISTAAFIPFSIRISETTNPLFSGNLALVNLSQDQLTFQIYEETAGIDNILFFKKGLDSTGTTISAINKTADDEIDIVFASNHAFYPGQKLIFSGMTLLAAELGYSIASDNFYTVNRVTATTLTLKDRNGTATPHTDFAILDNQVNDGTITASGNLPNGYAIPSGSSLTISASVTVTVQAANTAVTGSSTGRPFAFGKVSHVTPVIYQNKAGGIILNPELEIVSANPSVADTYLEVFEDGVLVNTAQASQPLTFATTPTSDIITMDSAYTGQISLSGVGSNGTTIQDFFNLVVSTISLTTTVTLDTTKAPTSDVYTPGFQEYADGILSSMVSATDYTTTDDIYISRDTTMTNIIISAGDTLTVLDTFTLTLVDLSPATAIYPTFVDALEIYETRNRPFLEFVNDIARSINYQFYIKNSVLYLIDRGNLPSVTQIFYEYEILETSYDIIPPIRSLQSEWSVNQPAGTAVTGATPEQGFPSLISIPKHAVANLLPTGQDIDIKPVHQNEQAMTAYLDSILDIAKKPIASVTVNGINSDLTFGDRIQYSRGVDYITADLMVRKIIYDFANEKTTFAGDATLTQLEAA